MGGVHQSSFRHPKSVYKKNPPLPDFYFYFSWTQCGGNKYERGQENGDERSKIVLIVPRRTLEFLVQTSWRTTDENGHSVF
ncbi:hypothetical protein CEXT_81631 [Caerostris extrusa]|uniref:Uncharacterized protein n=1 Tax=Caerostris extrusa TaxID=172846 RepID=A0AAV4N0E9_CAEEX|nr:hypothetical protein CEXT_81631 [Caerostris extrusa]